MEKISKESIYVVFIHLCNDLNKPCYVNANLTEKFSKRNEFYPKPKNPSHFRVIGTWQLDYQSCYGGWSIIETHNDKGGEINPFSHKREKTSEFYKLMNFARAILRISNEKKS